MSYTTTSQQAALAFVRLIFYFLFSFLFFSSRYRYLFQSFIVEEASGIFGEVELPSLDLLSEFPSTQLAGKEREKGKREIWRWWSYMVVFFYRVPRF